MVRFAALGLTIYNGEPLCGPFPIFGKHPVFGEFTLNTFSMDKLDLKMFWCFIEDVSRN